jgi:hypothetical protein
MGEAVFLLNWPTHTRATKHEAAHAEKEAVASDHLCLAAAGSPEAVRPVPGSLPEDDEDEGRRQRLVVVKRPTHGERRPGGGRSGGEQGGDINRILPQ